MYKINIQNLESKIKHKIKPNFCSIGWDIAEKCGISIVQTNKKEIEIDWILLEFDKKDIKQVYKQLTNESLKILQEKFNICIIEDTYLKWFGKFPQVDVLKKLSRFGGIVLANTINNNINFEIIGANSARSKFKIKTTGYGRGNSKQGVIDWIKNTLELDLTEDNCCDAIVLGLIGVCENMDFRSKKEISKTTKKKRKKTKK